MPKALDFLPVITASTQTLGATIRAAAKRGAANDKPKAVASIPKMKQVAKLASSMGLAVTGFTQNGDGGFTVSTTTPGISDTSGPSEWD